MVSAPTTTAGWTAFVTSVVALYVALFLALGNGGVLEAVGRGAFAGLATAIAVALLVVLWRGLPHLLFTERADVRRPEP